MVSLLTDCLLRHCYYVKEKNLNYKFHFKTEKSFLNFWFQFICLQLTEGSDTV
jgi:hypothetical protein